MSRNTGNSPAMGATGSPVKSSTLQIISVFSIVSCIKLLFIRLYHSTDLEVHRNWLAITYSLPISEWYTENTSNWTLDYPPLFAWFSLLLSYPAAYVDPRMLNVKNLNYKSPNAILYLRLSVIVTDIVLAIGTKQCCDYLASSGVRKINKFSSVLTSPAVVLQVLQLCNVGLLLVDHIHFQYNGILFGISLLSIAAMLKGQFVLSAFYFAMLLNAKHIFLYVSPVYFIYLLRNACFTNDPLKTKTTPRDFSLSKFRQIALVVIAVFAASLLPFILTGQSQALIQRLFPFKRGLFHSYWAPNVWALYCTLDKVLEVILRALGINVPHSNITTGITWDAKFSVLPNVSPTATFVLTFIAMTPCLLKLLRSPGNPWHFVRCLVICALTSYMFGWHVHEKAILMAIMPLTILAVVWHFEAKMFFMLSLTGYFSLLPLIPPGIETWVKFALFAGHLVYLCTYFSKAWYNLMFLNNFECLYLFGMGLVSIATIVLPNVAPHLEFLPLLLVSAYSSIGIVYVWARYYWHFKILTDPERKKK